MALRRGSTPRAAGLMLSRGFKLCRVHAGCTLRCQRCSVQPWADTPMCVQSKVSLCAHIHVYAAYVTPWGKGYRGVAFHVHTGARGSVCTDRPIPFPAGNRRVCRGLDFICTPTALDCGFHLFSHHVDDLHVHSHSRETFMQ